MAAPVLTNTFMENYAKTLQKLLGQRTVFMAVRGTEAEGSLHQNGGRTYTYLDLTEGSTQQYEEYTDATIDGFTVNPTVLTLNKKPMYTWAWDEFDGETHQANGSIIQKNTLAAYKKLNRDMSGDFFTLAAGQTSVNTFTNADLVSGGSGAITWDVSTTPQILTEARAKLRGLSGESEDDYAVVTPKQLAKIDQSVIANAFRESDSAIMRGIKPGMNGYVGTLYGVDIYECDFVPHSYTITYTGQPSNSETMSVGGVTITAETTTSTAGSFDIGGDADTTYANLVSLINAPTTSTGGATTAFAYANAKKMRGFYAVQNTSAGTVTIYSKWGSATITEGLTNATIGSQIVNNIMGKYGAIELAMWKPGIKMKTRPEPKQTSENYLVYTFYGTQVPAVNLNRYLKFSMTA